MYKCLFKQEVYKINYQIETNNYGFDSQFSRVIEDEPILIEEIVIKTGELKEPFLDKGDKCYIPNVGKNEEIVSVIANLQEDEQDVNVIYYIKPKYIEDMEEKNRLSKECEKITLEHENKILERNLKLLESFRDNVRNNFWYRFMKSKVEDNYVSKKSKRKPDFLLIGISLSFILLLLVLIFYILFLMKYLF